MFELISLPYGPSDLEPVISAQTLSFHHGKHLQAYVDNLNKLIAGGEFEGLSLEEIACKSSGGIFNNAGQILNHNLYFTQFAAKGVALADDGDLKAQIVKQWGSFEAFQAEFVAKGVGLFGSGWVWLSRDADGSLVITQEPGASNPVARGLKPLLTFDVWEHAYYLDYQNRRAAHLEALWQILDWSVIEKRYKWYNWGQTPFVSFSKKAKRGLTPFGRFWSFLHLLLYSQYDSVFEFEGGDGAARG